MWLLEAMVLGIEGNEGVDVQYVSIRDYILQLLQYMNHVKLKAAFIYLAIGSFSRSESLLHESGCDPREVGEGYSTECCIEL